MAGKEVLAVRWAAPEVLVAPSAWAAPWSEKSDVWAFGVCGWQVFCDGEARPRRPRCPSLLWRAPPPSPLALLFPLAQ